MASIAFRHLRPNSERINPVNMPDPIRKCFGYGQLWSLRPACSQNRAGYQVIIMPDPTSCIRFSSVFPKKAWITLCKTDSGPIWMAWSGSGQTRQVQKQARVLESPGQVSGRTQPVRCQFLTFTLVPFFHKHCAKPARIRFNSDLIPADCFQTDPVRKQANVQESSGPLLGNVSQPSRGCYALRMIWVLIL